MRSLLWREVLGVRVDGSKGRLENREKSLK